MVCISLIHVNAESKRYTHYFFDTFDTLVTLIGYTEDPAAFERIATQTEEELFRLHKLYDAYHEYDGIENIYTINRDAATAPVHAAPEIMDMLLFTKKWQPKLNGAVNIAMGSVLQLWHEYRTLGTAHPETAALPPAALLQEASLHTNFDDVFLDEKNSTVYFNDAKLQLDVGAVAKGYAAELAAQMLLQSDMPNFILNVGGNVRTGNPPINDRKNWSVSIQNPDAALGIVGDPASAETLYLSDLSVVTSGDYERFYVVDSVRYHHIISPQTFMPSAENRSVTIVCEDSALADILSTAVFILPYEEGRAIVESLEGVEALWIRPNGDIFMTDGLEQMTKS